MSLEREQLPPPESDIDDLPPAESEYDRAHREFREFMSDETVTDRWSAERIKARDKLISAITAASRRRHGLDKKPDKNAP
jgi:hypothetical protein